MRQEPTLLPSLELILRTEDGDPWVLKISPGMERFIGCYARIVGFAASEDHLLRFTPAAE